jgi:protein-S-isoprenylcysteine O-methyltransferase Ste14
MAGFGMIGIVGVMAAWVVFAVAFLVRRWSMPRASQTREPVAWLGIGLQAIAFACIWNAARVPMGAPLFIAGTLIRVRAEEHLLRERFGPEYDAFARRVPALIPRLRGARTDG